MSTEITVDDAAHALWSVGDGRGRQPGSFTSALLTAIGHADLGNRARLFEAFPGLLQAVMLAQSVNGREELARLLAA
ncbi:MULTISPECIES: hypothetical protein [unclassified Leucobacter]|uniref:hypothetical protein n=1 Tax=unclassified Leucobacter TaxID=2621730 RepID=UPI000622A8FB|nr:hypothetical protein [Leucobacter sp. Ag1]KKI16402.1 hypothetical protein XM48_16575 [Leucobacter sp. Ag1]